MFSLRVKYLAGLSLHRTFIFLAGVSFIAAIVTGPSPAIAQRGNRAFLVQNSSNVLDANQLYLTLAPGDGNAIEAAGGIRQTVVGRFWVNADNGAQSMVVGGPAFHGVTATLTRPVLKNNGTMRVDLQLNPVPPGRITFEYQSDAAGVVTPLTTKWKEVSIKLVPIPVSAPSTTFRSSTSSAAFRYVVKNESQETLTLDYIQVYKNGDPSSLTDPQYVENGDPVIPPTASTILSPSAEYVVDLGLVNPGSTVSISFQASAPDDPSIADGYYTLAADVADATVGAQGLSWGRVKSLYR